jgi:phosphate-selective porin OprO/OprP
MTMIRWEWDFLGEVLPYSQSDLAMRPTPAASLAFGTARVDGPYTRFSTAGGGQLDGFEPGDSTRYSIEQWLQEFAWHYHGFSLQQEYHVKTVVDRDLQRESELSGGYVQAGKIWPVELASRVLPIELALRYARIDWDQTALDRELEELTLALNVFFEGHRNKLTFDVSRLDVVEAPSAGHDTRLRAQWEVSF